MQMRGSKRQKLKTNRPINKGNGSKIHYSAAKKMRALPGSDEMSARF
jgi:hypothetical protein